MSSIVIPNKKDVVDARALIEPYIHNTPVMSSSSINEIYGVELYLKCENFQKMGAFKMRGAAHAILKLSDEAREKGVTTHSSGNFAQALSLAARSLGVKATIVMPTSAPKIKKTAVLGYGTMSSIATPPFKHAKRLLIKSLEKPEQLLSILPMTWMLF